MVQRGFYSIRHFLDFPKPVLLFAVYVRNLSKSNPIGKAFELVPGGGFWERSLQRAGNNRSAQKEGAVLLKRTPEGL